MYITKYINIKNRGHNVHDARAKKGVDPPADSAEEAEPTTEKEGGSLQIQMEFHLHKVLIRFSVKQVLR